MLLAPNFPGNKVVLHVSQIARYDSCLSNDRVDVSSVSHKSILAFDTSHCYYLTQSIATVSHKSLLYVRCYLLRLRRQ
jgi:hypothetical protein